MSPDDLRSFLESLLPEATELLRQLVEQNSFSYNPDGIARVSEILTDAFSPLGFSAQQFPSDTPDTGSHLRLSSGTSHQTTFALIGHLDTVFSPEEEEQHNFRWWPDGSKAYGPGTVDMKGGIVVCYMVLRALQEYSAEKFARTRWEVLLNSCEELSVTPTTSFQLLCRDVLPPDSTTCLVFEGGHIREGTAPLATARKALAKLRIAAHGKSAHAGVGHQTGANAILQLSEVLSPISALTDYDRGVSVNVGTIKGGTVSNRVPNFAEVLIDLRAAEEQHLDEVIARILSYNGYSTVQSADQCAAAKIETELLHRSPAWPAGEPKTEQLFAVYKKAASLAELEVEREHRAGGSDACGLASLFPTIDGLGPGGAHLHCSHFTEDGGEPESVQLDTFAPKALLSALAIDLLLEK